MTRAIVNVATGRYVTGQRRLQSLVHDADVLAWADQMPPNSPPHQSVPYAFKAWAFEYAREQGYDLVLWADACIVPIRSLDPLWERIERDGYWVSRNGYRNSEWTCDAAYPLLGVTREENDGIDHVVATTFGLNLRSEIGRRALDEYLRFAQNGAFCGPWRGGIGIQHRHDQTALSVIAHRLGMELTNPPAWFAYRGGETEETVLCADGAY